MARMFPDPLPPETLNDPSRSGERKVFEALRAQLDDSWYVFGNLSWVRPRPGGGIFQGEADAVVMHADHGILVLEVKGGGVHYDGATGTWHSRSRSGQTFEIKNPFEQARRSARNLVAMLGECTGMPRDVTVATGVVFPDSRRPAGTLAPDAPHEMALFAEDMEGLGPRLAEMIALPARGGVARGPGKRGAETVREVLAPVIDLAVPLVHRLNDDEQVILQLTEGQGRVPEYTSRQRRVAVSGGAGTGKSVLAVV